MHIHLPKPLHGWREFVGEVGIIVVGVLIALSAEQVAEAWHWHHVVAEQTEAMDEEARSAWDALSSRVAQQACIDRRLDDLALVFARHDAGQSLGLTRPIGRPRVWTARRTALQIAVADQSISHMSRQQKQTYFGVYEALDVFEKTVGEERDSWRSLQGLNHAASLSNSDWQGLRKAYDAALDSNATLKANLVMSQERWLSAFKNFPRWPLKRSTLTLQSVVDLCSPALSTAPRA